MNSSELNLARKWRPTTFEAIIGQDLTVRLLKNSLFKQQFFPVYLLAGQRGCGKTTTGRIFAAAINCAQLDAFAKNPKLLLPCGACTSCIAMRQGNHPDFIEIDAASHTGVDNVRQIIEATSFLPHMGRKKIYLIDEAHMLSKAAFNAFLKILEEPPRTVLFMMATTDPHKIIDTVRSRCFQLFFDPVADELLSNHLAVICERESLSYEPAALTLLIREAEGSIRDALNLLERVRLMHDAVTVDIVKSMFGSFEHEIIVELLETIAASDAGAVLELWKKYQLETRPAGLLWKKIFEGLRALLLLTYHAYTGEFTLYDARLRACAQAMKPTRIVSCMELIFTFEQQFLKTAAEHAMLEMLLVKMCTPVATVTAPVSVSVSKSEVPVRQVIASAREAVPVTVTLSGPARDWKECTIRAEKALTDPLCISIIKQGVYQQTDATGFVWQIAFPKELALFEDTLEKHREVLKTILTDICKKSINIHCNFTLETKKSSTLEPMKTHAAPRVTNAPQAKPATRSEQKKSVDVSDTEKWEKTHSLLAIFPGTVSDGSDVATVSDASTSLKDHPMSKLPLVAIVGRMNVGKSTLFNRLSRSVKSITYEHAGVTRDILKDVVSWQGRSFELVDTGGISFRKSQDPLLEKVREKALNMLEQADVIIFVCDGIIGVVPEDRDIAKMLHKLHKKVILVINKIDSHQAQHHAYEFERLGFSDSLTLSAQHGTNIGELLESILQILPAHGGKPAEEAGYKVALLGRPNVGKSSLMNALTQQERSIVSNIPGTTREAVHERVAFYQKQIDLIDTPGVRRKRAVEDGLETMMVHSALQAIKNTDIVLLMIDAAEGTVVDQELKLGFYAFADLYKALILIINKDDLETEDTRKTLDTELDIYQHFIKKIPVMHISCKTGKNVGKVLPLISKIWDRNNLALSDEELSQLFISSMKQKPLMHTGQRLHVHRAYQIGKAPMRIVLEVNEPDWFGESQLKFFENLLRKNYDLIGVPVKFVVRKQQ